LWLIEANVFQMPQLRKHLNVSGYTMRPLYIFITILFVSISSIAQMVVEDRQLYDYQTTLKGGYRLALKFDSGLQYLYLKKGSKTISELSSTSKGLPYKNLGYVIADFKNYFVLAHSFGGGNPTYIALIDKESGKNILKLKRGAALGAAIIDVLKEREMVLYSYNDVPNEKDKMILHNVNSGKKEYFLLPSDVFGEPEILNRIKISSLTDTHLVIKYETENGAKTKQYSR
jgi:hypothetical protein